MAKVKIPTPLQKFTGNKTIVDAEGSTVGDVIKTLVQTYPGIEKRLYSKGNEVNRYINIYVDGEDIRFNKGVDTPVGGASEVSIVPAISGG